MLETESHDKGWVNYDLFEVLSRSTSWYWALLIFWNNVLKGEKEIRLQHQSPNESESIKVKKKNNRVIFYNDLTIYFKYRNTFFLKLIILKF